MKLIILYQGVRLHGKKTNCLQALERLAGIMESESSSIALVERGDSEPIPRHPDFRIFAAMNPATDAGTQSLLSPMPSHGILPIAFFSDFAHNIRRKRMV